MPALIPDFGWFLIALSVGATILAMLHILASVVRNATYLHDVKVDVARLQARYARQLRELEGVPVDEAQVNVDVLDDAEEAAIPIDAGGAAAEPEEQRNAA